jgi:hypothetical protein
MSIKNLRFERQRKKKHYPSGSVHQSLDLGQTLATVLHERGSSKRGRECCMKEEVAKEEERIGSVNRARQKRREKGAEFESCFG